MLVKEEIDAVELLKYIYDYGFVSSNDGNIFGIPKEDSTELPLNGFPQTAKFQKIYQKICFFFVY